MRRFSKIFGLAGVLALALVLPAQGAFIYKTGARPMSMGGSFVAVADDANAVFLNPAGLTQLSGKELTTTYARLFPCVEDDKLHQGMVGFVLPMGGVGVIGLGWQTFMSDLWDDNAITLSFARGLTESLSMGLNVRAMMWKADLSGLATPDPLGDSVSSGLKIGADLGVLWRSPWQVKAGLFVKNLNQPDVAEDSSIDGGKLPMEIHAGLAYDLMETLVSAQLVSVEGDTRFTGGVERQFAGTGLSLSGGWAGGADMESRLNMGVGYQLRKIAIHVSYLLYGDTFNTEVKDGDYSVSFGYKF
ncbi:MAG: hypothetical protein KAJ05_03880 [Candidatus Latescibacteria bacterium]|nr:hypothetical protein [Candidatus Latescibacterota bacterium]MCK5381788.1 hypothetical protein [Candidatus Latescibacterota bacterium]MCK5526260.1 hypothetical protein [Candidatus Latescibacterota bacterium]